ncbi:MAG: hypothetical protein MJZ33_02760 [Paludibacteraceae bacterium]|nr:hypothetical protein [Paludibacteraceae bacterium]
MNRVFSCIYLILMTFCLMACQNEEVLATPPANNVAGCGKTLVVYYSYTGNSEEIVNTLLQQISADVIKIEPAEKELDYAANNYAIGTEQLNKIKANPNDESSYPAIDPVEVEISQYANIIIATPLWWSQMASNMQTFLFKYGKEMEDKNIGLIVSSHSSGISGVEADCKRLVPDGNHLKSLWINASKHSQRASLIEQWLQEINFNDYPSTNTGQALENDNMMNLIVNNTTMKVKLADNAATKALIERLKEGTITYNAHDYGGFEKVGSLGFSLPSNDTYITTEPGDIILYTSNQLCIFFDSNSWDYTPIGKIEGMTKQQLKEAFGTGEVSITLFLGSTTGTASISVNKAEVNSIYGLSGQKLAQVPAKGVYIENGIKKVK